MPGIRDTPRSAIFNGMTAIVLVCAFEFHWRGGFRGQGSMAF